MLNAAIPFVFVLLWSTGFVGAKFGLIDSNAATFLLIRMTLNVLVFVAILLVMKPVMPKGMQIVHALVSGLLIHGFYLGGVFAAIGARHASGPFFLVSWASTDSHRSDRREYFIREAQHRAMAWAGGRDHRYCLCGARQDELGARCTAALRLHVCRFRPAWHYVRYALPKTLLSGDQFGRLRHVAICRSDRRIFTDCLVHSRLSSDMDNDL